MKIKDFLEIIKQKRTTFDIICILIVTMFLSIPIMHENTDIYLGDGSQHLMRAYGTYQAIKENGTGIIISDFTNKFGYSWNLFNAPLSSYSIILASIIFGSFNFGFKLILFLIILLAGLFMYKLMSEIFENNDVALLSSVIYVISPYFFTAIYVRHEIGEAILFVFMPMVFLGLYNLFNTQKNHYYLIFGAVRNNIIT